MVKFIRLIKLILALIPVWRRLEKSVIIDGKVSPAEMKCLADVLRLALNEMLSLYGLDFAKVLLPKISSLEAIAEVLAKRLD